MRRSVVELGFDLSGSARRQLILGLTLSNLLFGATTAAFIFAWGRLEEYSPGLQRLIKYGLVQGHLATENVLAAWYSSMLLLSVTLASCFAFSVDRDRSASALRWGWLVVAWAFTTLSLDEIGSLHERIGMIKALGSGDRAVGWVFVLAVPIAAVALFLLAFAWLHVRRAPQAFRWMAAGIALFLANPVFEAVEMQLIHGAGAHAGTWQRTLHDALLVLEEGLLELFGTLCFLTGTVSYVAFRSGGHFRWAAGVIRVKWLIRLGTTVMVAGVFVSAWVVARLPAGDTGIPSNWFPAAVFFAAAVAARGNLSLTGRTRAALAVIALALSGACGAGLYGYSETLLYGAPMVAALATVVAGWLTEAALVDGTSTAEGQEPSVAS